MHISNKYLNNFFPLFHNELRVILHLLRLAEEQQIEGFPDRIVVRPDATNDSRILGIDQSDFSKSLQRLEQKGFIRAEEEKGRGRQTVYSVGYKKGKLFKVQAYYYEEL